MKVSIIGVGWLGEQIADYLLKNKIEILGTTTKSDKAQRLINKGINALQLDLSSPQLAKNIWSEIAQSDWIIFTIPPSSFGNTYAAHCIRFFEQLQQSVVEGTIIFTSSTSVYGNETRIVDEDSKLNPVSENAKQIVKVEDFIQNNFDRYSIWRMGGLVGPERHPVNYLTGRSGISKPKAPVNLVHSADIINVFEQFISNEFNYPILNVCSPEHPTKEEYYTRVAEQLNKSLPIFDAEDQQLDKTVQSKYLKQAAFQYIYPSPFDYPQAQKNE